MAAPNLFSREAFSEEAKKRRSEEAEEVIPLQVQTANCKLLTQFLRQHPVEVVGSNLPFRRESSSIIKFRP